MANQQKLAIVTGANKGIGLEIARALSKHDGFKCILAARSEERGSRAAQELSADGANVEFRQLDLDNDDSIDQFIEGISTDYGKVDVLVNNAAIAFKAADPTPFHEQTAPTFHTNFWQTTKFTDRMLPLLVPGSRIVFLASSAGRLDILNQSPEKKAFISRPDLTLEQLFDFINEVRDSSRKNYRWAV
jgi:NAD(P)-dependent dehydrogenase (short-subunit alcohol dehydrogenase family)